MSNVRKLALVGLGVVVVWATAIATNLLWLRRPGENGVWVVAAVNVVAGLTTVAALVLAAITGLRHWRRAHREPAGPPPLRGVISLMLSLMVANSIVLGIYGMEHPDYLFFTSVLVIVTWAYVRPVMKTLVRRRGGRA